MLILNRNSMLPGINVNFSITFYRNTEKEISKLSVFFLSEALTEKKLFKFLVLQTSPPCPPPPPHWYININIRIKENYNLNFLLNF